MLYISRRAGLNEYGVVDTDDGVEEIVKYPRLSEIIGNFDLDILGVESKIVELVSGSYKALTGVSVYQDEKYLTASMVKLKTMCHVNIKVWNGMITDLTWDGAKIKSPVTVRLSDYGHSVAPRILSDNLIFGSHKITIVLDDNVSFACEAFMASSITQNIGINGFGAVFDLQELSDTATAGLVYNAVYMHSMDGYRMLKSIIDTPKRKHLMAERLNLVV